jgi:hypothetical protein
MGTPPGSEQPVASSTGADTAAMAANQRENGTTRPSILAIGAPGSANGRLIVPRWGPARLVGASGRLPAWDPDF